MTRFMMTLEDAVDLNQYAFQHGRQGDLFVQKAPAATIETLAHALMELYETTVPIRIIGTRMGEIVRNPGEPGGYGKSGRLGDYYRIPADNRDLNYNQYFSEGVEDVSKIEEYHSHNTHRLGKEGMKELLLKLPMIRKDVIGEVSSIHYAE